MELLAEVLVKQERLAQLVTQVFKAQRAQLAQQGLVESLEQPERLAQLARQGLVAQLLQVVAVAPLVQQALEVLVELEVTQALEVLVDLPEQLEQRV